MDFRKITIEQLHNMYKSGEVTALEVTEQVAANIKENKYNESISFCDESALKQAKEVDQAGVKNIFDGIPCVIKDNINYTGYNTTCGSKILENYKSIYNATVTDKLLNNNCVIHAKANMDEFAMGCSNTTSHFGNVLNPHDTNRIPGGSSGGSAVAVASGIVPFALGSDTGGSVRQPAAYCNIVGFRPTYGMISRYGLVSLNTSLDQISIFANNVVDTALVYDMLQGKDSRDATTLDVKVVASKNLDFECSGKRIAVERTTLTRVAEAMSANIEDVIKFLKSQGITVDIIDMKYMEHAAYIYLGLVATEITSNLSMFDGIRYGHRTNDYKDLNDLYTYTRGEGFGREVKRRMLIGSYLLKQANYDRYHELLQLRRLVVDEYNEIFKDYDFVITSTTPTTAYTFDEFENNTNSYYESEFVESTALAGLPAISVPMGFEKSTKMPQGLHIIGQRKEDAKVLAFANYFMKHYEVGEF